MNEERIKVQLQHAVDMLQVITDDVEANFITPRINSIITARANLTVSSLAVVSAFLRHVCEEVSA